MEYPNCGKLTMHLGNEWTNASPRLFPPQLLLSLLNYPWHYLRSIEERAAFYRGVFDFLQCAQCGTITELRHTPLIMQSSFKGIHPPFSEEIQRDMRVEKEIKTPGKSQPHDLKEDSRDRQGDEIPEEELAHSKPGWQNQKGQGRSRSRSNDYQGTDSHYKRQFYISKPF